MQVKNNDNNLNIIYNFIFFKNFKINDKIFNN